MVSHHASRRSMWHGRRSRAALTCAVAHAVCCLQVEMVDEETVLNDRAYMVRAHITPSLHHTRFCRNKRLTCLSHHHSCSTR